MRRLPALAISLALVLALAGCGNDSTASGSGTTKAPTTKAPTTEVPSGSSTEAPAAATGVSTVKLASSDYGKILTTGDGKTLYRFTPDTGTTSTCTGGCAAAWPALTGPATGDGVHADDLGTTTRDDGTVQVTFYGHPVYNYADDPTPGDINGEGVGGKWYVIDSEGNSVMAKTGATTATTAATKGGY